MIARILMVISLVLAAASVPAAAGEPMKPTPLSQLPKPLQSDIIKRLRDMEIKPDMSMTYASDATERCPDYCNRSAGGGFCYCDPKGGKCPEGTDPTGTPDNKECKVRLPKGFGGVGEVFGGGLPEKITIEW